MGGRAAIAPLVLVAAAVAAGCGGGDGDGDDLAEAKETAQAWVAALNREDYERACELSVVDDDAECISVLRMRPFGRGLRVEGFRASDAGRDVARFGTSNRRDRTPRGPGWTAYAPLDGFSVERHQGELRVHWEVSIIR